MAWLTIAVVLAAAGLLVVAVCAARLVVALRRLSREVTRTRAVLEPRRVRTISHRDVSSLRN